MSESGVFYRNVRSKPVAIVKGKGVELWDENGKRYIDAVGGTAVVSIGHGVKDIYDAIHTRRDEIIYVYGATLTNRWQEELARAVLSVAPKNMRKVYFVSGGSEANETAIKMARQYHLHRGKASKSKIIARWQGFHGVTIATLSLSGRPSWREPYDPWMLNFPHIVPPSCYRCPFNLTYPGCGVLCAQDLERQILMEGPDNVAAFIAEPVIGTSATGIVPVPEYYRMVREICDKYDVLFIADEVLCGYGRTGYEFAIDMFGVEADIITAGKAISSGYAPLACAIASEKVVEAYTASPSGEFTHGFTHAGNAFSCFVGNEVFKYMQKHNLFRRPAQIGGYLHEQLAGLQNKHGIIGEVRGRGLLAGVEFVQDRKTRAAFPAETDLTNRIVTGAREKGVLLIPGMKNSNHGKGGDHIQITPPYVITQDEVDEVVAVLDQVLTDIERTL